MVNVLIYVVVVWVEMHVDCRQNVTALQNAEHNLFRGFLTKSWILAEGYQIWTPANIL